jgi:endonuclease/exonuclease/phosphatase family metal-dependent hydrolase
MKLLQLNVWQGRFSRQIVKFLEAEQPDILCLQEVFSTSTEVKIPENMFDILQQILAKTGYEHHYFSPVFGMAVAGTTAEYGNAIVSRYPLVDCRTVFTEGEYNPSMTLETYFNNTRNLQLARVVTPSGDLQLANHHGHWEKTPEGNEQSLASMQVVAAELDKLSGPHIFAGDLNVRANTPTMKLFEGKLRNLTEEYQLPTTLSIVGKVQNIACDHILVSDDIQVKAFRAADELLSDHKALILDFEL